MFSLQPPRHISTLPVASFDDLTMITVLSREAEIVTAVPGRVGEVTDVA